MVCRLWKHIGGVEVIRIVGGDIHRHGFTDNTRRTWNRVFRLYFSLYAHSDAEIDTAVYVVVSRYKTFIQLRVLDFRQPLSGLGLLFGCRIIVHSRVEGVFEFVK